MQTPKNPTKDALLAARVERPAEGQLLLPLMLRGAYETSPSLVLVDLNRLNSATAKALLSKHSACSAAPAPQPYKLLRACVHGLNIDAQAIPGSVVDLVVRAEQKHRSTWGRFRQNVAHALFRAGDLCHPGHHHGATGAVALPMPSQGSNNQPASVGSHPDARQVLPLHFSDGKTYYNALLLHESVKHHTNRGLTVWSWLGRQKGTDDAHGVKAPVDKAAFSGRWAAVDSAQGGAV